MGSEKQTKKLQECGKKFGGDGGFELIPVAIVNGGTDAFQKWQKSQTGQNWLNEFSNVNVVHYPYKSFEFLQEQLLANAEETARNSKLLAYLYGKLVEKEGLDVKKHSIVPNNYEKLVQQKK